MNGALLLTAALDNFTELCPEQILDQLTDLLVKVSIACIQGKDGFEREQVVALAATYMAFVPDAEPVSGREAEEAYHDAYQAVWKQEMDTAEDSECWNGDGDFDWTSAGYYPLAILKRVARACASQDAVNTQAWYKWCRENADVVAGRSG